jgi:hypothetical protein
MQSTTKPLKKGQKQFLGFKELKRKYFFEKEKKHLIEFHEIKRNY